MMTTPKMKERTACEEIDDASVSIHVKTMLLAHRPTRSVNTKGITCSGEAALTGIVKSEAEKSRGSRLAADIQGVTGMDNQMTLKVPRTK